MSVHVFGIRHHGPGCARALCSALSELAPDALLVEGPPDANDALRHVANAGLMPPIALLIHALDNPQNAVFYPFAEFSPEWQALRFGVSRGVSTRFIDLPCAHSLALRADEAARAATSDAPAEGDGDDDADGDEDADGEGRPRAASDAEEERALHEDPIGLLANAAGFADREQWWDVQVEQRRQASGLFEAILEAVGTLRERHDERDRFEQMREAHMRNALRAAQKEGFQRIAVVCGAWHAPALASLGPAKADNELLKGLPKLKVQASWIPWSHARLAYRSGYGAGIDSPGWYGHVWRHGERAPLIWATLAARLLREQDLDASAANVIETVRLSHALASVRQLPTPGLGELREAIAAVLCAGEAARGALIRARLEIGGDLGQVPEDVGQAPIWRDFEQELKRLRLKLSSELVTLELDLRKEIDLGRSRLLHRLRILGIEWGRLQSGNRGAGTFKELWQVAWQPELAVELVAANIHGTQLESATAHALAERARSADLSALTALLESALLAHLPSTLSALLGQLDARAATTSDVRIQMEALPPLARLVRYGDVRETRADHVLPVLRALFARVVVGLLPACTQVDDDAAGQLLHAIGLAHGACLLLDQPEIKGDWLSTLRRLTVTAAVHPRIAGRACRLCHEQHVLAEGALEQLASLALSPSVEPARAAQWIEGLVTGEGLSLTHQTELLRVLDVWIAGLADDAFQAELPLLRRAFSSLTAPERRAVGERMARGGDGATSRGRVERSLELDPARVALVTPVLAKILGVSHA